MKTTHVDWLSFTCKLRNPIESPDFALETVKNSLAYRLGAELFTEVFAVDGWKLGGGRRPYREGFSHERNGVHVWFGGQNTILVEFTGTGTAYLEEIGKLHDMVTCIAGDATRLDIAVDLIGDVRPLEIVTTLGNKRIKSDGYKRSDAGETYYIGSRTSQRFCRVYRYNEPHPRADRTRVEYELKKMQAKVGCAYVSAYGAAYVADMMQEIYKWEHKEMKKENQYAPALPSERADRTDSKTLHWILKQCAPAFKRLVEKGAIKNPQQIFEQYFLPEPDRPLQTTFMEGLDENE